MESYFAKLNSLNAIKIVLALSMLIGMLMSWKLWIASRFYPLTPVFNFLSLGFPFDYIVFVGLLTLLISIIFLRKPQKAIISFIILASLWTLFDQSRWQPWFYQYLVMFAVLAYFWNKSNNKQIINYALRLVIANIYIWSGLQKVNPEFLNVVGPAIFEFFTKLQFSSKFSLAFVLIEIIIGLGLLSRKYVKQAAVLGIVMHLIILILVGPLGLNINSVIWPWNIAMILFLIIFMRDASLSLPEFLKLKNFKPAIAILIIFSLLPILSFAAEWDSFPSWSLFSGNTDTAVIIISNNSLEKLPLREHIKIINNQNVLNIGKWTFAELNTPPYPESRIYRNVAQNLCAYDPNLILVLREKWHVYKSSASFNLTCSQLNR